ncbi:MAG: rhomboid family intramembrane serine protease [Planctomycetota bacterium]|nr:rhomboid family intramembrane serine protease [Planctomycetota bacterium]
MRQIGSIPDETDAKRFGDYLLSAGMKNHVEEDSSGWAVWVEDDDKLDAAKAELEAFRANSTDAKYSTASRKAEKIRVEEEKKQKRLAKRFHDVRTSWGAPQQWAMPVSMALILLSLLAAAATALGENVTGPGMNALQIQSVKYVDTPDGMGMIVPPMLHDVRRGQVWRLITPIFLHMGVLHLIFNMIWLRDFGSQIERHRSSGYVLLLVVVAAIVSNLAQYWWSDSPRFGGMSGVVYALFGYVWIKGRCEPHLGMGVSQQTVLFMLGWMVFCIIMPTLAVANAAHVLGLVVGVAMAYAPIELRKVRRRLRS